VKKSESPNFKDAVITITGGTGSFGNTMARNLLTEDVKEIRIFSRDENKQDLMRNEIRDERLRFFIGDVRNIDGVRNVVRGSDYVFHAAALKQVPSCEFFPMEAVATNVMGSNNVLSAAYEFEIKSLVCLSTDKAVYPINAMGTSKAMMEKIAQSFARNNPNSATRVSITRYGNVMMSRGSVIPLFLQQLLTNAPVTVTNPNMTRFLMSLQESVGLVKYAFTHGNPGDLFIKKAPACTVEVLVEALVILTGKQDSYEVKNIGTRHGEKHYEVLVSSEEMAKSSDEQEYYRVPLDSRSLDYQIYFDKGQEELNESQPFTSHNTRRLDSREVAQLISELPEYQSIRKRFE